MKIEVLYLEGCPNHPPTIDLVQRVVSEHGIEAAVEAVEVRDAEDAERLRFLGSPTIRVDGKDIEPAARVRTDYSFCCRVYGGSGTPPRELVEDALESTTI